MGGRGGGCNSEKNKQLPPEIQYFALEPDYDLEQKENLRFYLGLLRLSRWFEADTYLNIMK